MSTVRVRHPEARRRAGARTLVRYSWLLVVAAALPLTGCRCETKSTSDAPVPSASAALAPELAAKVLAKVGSREITLGEFASALARMDPFERMRYQSPERRRKLLEEMVDAELLAQEARRRGLDTRPEAEVRIRAVLRDELLARVRADVPGPESISEREVRAYYDAHREELRSPERRRVSVIMMEDAAKAREALEKARAGGAPGWGALVKEYSRMPRAPELGAEAPELAGDQGFVTLPGESKADGRKLPDAVRRAVFAIPALGQVYPEVVEADGKQYIVRMTSKSAAGLRSYAEADRTIRALLAEAKVKAAEEAFERELARRYPLKVDEAALRGLEMAPHPAASGARDAGGD